MIFIIFFMILVPIQVFSQGQSQVNDFYLREPDTIVFVSEEIMNYSEEHLMIHFYAIDEGEKQPVPANFKIYNKKRNKLLSGAPEDKHMYQASLVSNEEYLIEVKAPGYITYSEYFSPRASSDRKDIKKVIAMEKANFMVELMAINGENGEIVKNAAITLVNTTSEKTIHTLVNPETGNCRADFDLNAAYQVEVVADGYFPYYEEYFTENKLGSKKFVMTPSPTLSSLKIRVEDAASNLTVPARVVVLNKDKKETHLKWKKDYAVANLLSGAVYNVFVEADGYEKYEGNLYLESGKENFATIELNPIPSNVEENHEVIFEEPEKPAMFENIESGKAVVLKNIFFDQSKFDLKEDSFAELDRLVNTLKTNPKYKITIAGYTDNQGDKRLNQLLSQNRAKVIANYLIEQGIEEERLEVIGYGSAHPIAPNDTEANRKLNRRVEFTVK